MIEIGENSYVSLEEVTEYAKMFGYSDFIESEEPTDPTEPVEPTEETEPIVNPDDELKEQAIFRSMRYLESLNYIGERTDKTQSLSFPRSGLSFDGISLDKEEVPEAIKKAQCEATIQEYLSPNSFFPEQKKTNIKVKKIGSLRTEYFSEGIKMPVYPAVMNYLKAFLKNTNRVIRT